MYASFLRFCLTIMLVLFIRPVLAQQTEDPYLWLEKIDDEKALNWVHAQNKLTEDALTGTPGFDSLFQKTLEIYNSKDRIAYPTIRGNYLYNFWQDGQHERGILRRTSLSEYKKEVPDWEIVLDIDALNKAENENWVYKGANWLYPEYNRCILRLSRGGGDAVVMREFDAVQKEFVKDGFYLPEAKGSVSWLDENTVFISSDFGPGSLTNSGYPRITKLWHRGTPVAQAETLFEGDTTDVSVGSYALPTPDRTYQIVYRGITFYTSKYFARENGKLIPLNIPLDADFNGIFKNQVLLQLKSDWQPADTNFKQGSLLSIDYDALLNGSTDFKIIVEPDDRSSISSVSSTKNMLLINLLSNVRSNLYMYRLVNNIWVKEKVDTNTYGSISITSTEDFSDHFFFTYTSFLSPSSLYYVADTGEIHKLKSLPDFFDSSKFKVEQFHAGSKDGTQIPYFVVSAKNQVLDGSAPTLLYGYGGFEVSKRPRYSATIGSSWLEKGGVYVLANIRGGGEFGPKWHLAALKENRQRAFDDFIAVAEDLIERKISSPRHLGIQGGSNGGLLVGAVFTQRPDLFNAVVCAVPLLDMKRFNKLLAGASWMGEYGNPDIPEEWAYIQKYSPYQNVFADKKYPRIFLTTTTRDDRVHPGHARKMAAKMIDQGHQVYYFENTEGGHGSGTTNKQWAYSSALIFTYLLHQLQ